MRAILFAKATVTSLTGRRSRIPLVHPPTTLFLWGSVNHRRGTEDKQPADFPVARFGDPTQAGLPAGGILSWHQAAKCRALLNRPTSTTVAAISDAVIGPTPGIVARRHAVSSCRA